MKRIGLLCLALVLALGALGVGYAMWSDTLQIEGEVNTGELSVIFDSQYDNDPSDNDPKEAGSWNLTTLEWEGARWDKNVASTTSTFDDKSARIVVTLGYPCYWGSVLWDVHNVGTIPAKLHSITLTKLSKQLDEWPMNKALDIDTRYYVDVEQLRVNKVLQADDDFSFILSAFNCTQIDACQVGYLDVTVHVEQDAEQKKTYDFVIDYVFANWNE